MSAVNPAAIKAFAGGRLSRAQTDRVGAALVTRFRLAQKPPSWATPAPGVRRLRALVRGLEPLILGARDGRGPPLFDHHG